MVERVATKVRDAEPDIGQCYSAQLKQREDFIERQHTASLVIKASEDFQLCPQGLAAHYLGPAFPDTLQQDWWVFIHEIRDVSGRHRHQGGLVLFVLDGHGYTTMNGVRYDWKKGDLILMPLMPEGVEHQHFNLTEDRSAKWLAFIHTPTFDEVASELVQTALDPEWAKANGVTVWRGASVADEQATAAVV